MIDYLFIYIFNWSLKLRISGRFSPTYCALLGFGV